jgi:hypothetical protein
MKLHCVTASRLRFIDRQGTGAVEWESVFIGEANESIVVMYISSRVHRCELYISALFVV